MTSTPYTVFGAFFGFTIVKSEILLYVKSVLHIESDSVRSVCAVLTVPTVYQQIIRARRSAPRPHDRTVRTAVVCGRAVGF